MKKIKERSKRPIIPLVEDVNWWMLRLAHKQLDVYRISLELVKEIYSLSAKFPSEERFGLQSQLRRAVISLCSNIAEGSSRISKKEKSRFYEISRSSLVEIDTQIEIALILNYVEPGDCQTLGESTLSIFRMLSQLINKLTSAPAAD